MVAYRRCLIEGGTYFFTVALADRRRQTLVEHVDALRVAVVEVRRRWPFSVDAMVVLPDHLHAVWRLPAGDARYPTRWRLIKSSFARELVRRGQAEPHRSTGERLVWQRRFWEHAIRDEMDHQRHIDYVHHNPVKHGLVRAARDWPYSTFHRYVRHGILAPDWASPAEAIADTTAFGE